MRVTQKGQVTIPKHVRDRLGIKPGSEVDFVDTNGQARLVVASKTGARISATEYAKRIERASRYFDISAFRGMDGKAYIDWLRGPREDVDLD